FNSDTYFLCVLHFFFFFQAEDGIRDGHVTGVQTCALPILPSAAACSRTAAALGSAVNQAAAGVRIAKTPLMVMSLLASSFAWSSEPTAANRVTFTSLDQVTRVAIATGGKVQYQAIGRLQNPDRLYYDL